MKPEEIYSVWAPADSIWSPWVLPVAFAQLNCADFSGAANDADLHQDLSWMPDGEAAGLAIVADLPGEKAIQYGLALAARGMRPVPVIDGSPGAGEFYLNQDSPQTVTPSSLQKAVVDMSGLLRMFCAGAIALPRIALSAQALPAFLLDSHRMTGHRVLSDEMFDNRWQVFAQDFPSARFLVEHGVQRVVLVQEQKGQPQEDLAHVLLRWQEGGISLQNVGTQEGGPPEPILIARPSYFRRIWQRALAILGLWRSPSGGFGNWPTSSAG
jgi:hypothetical protein